MSGRGVRGLAWLLATAAYAGGGPALAKDDWTSNWSRWPTAAERDAALAGVAPQEGQLLRAMVRCAVRDTGALGDCRVIAETPAATGLGEALLSLTSKYARKPPGERDLRDVDLVEYVSSIDVAPDWRKKPSPHDLIAVFPTQAYKNGQSGRAVITCVVTTQGALKDCVVVDEWPAGAGFGGAAIALTPQFLMRPATKGGRPVESTARIPIDFKTFGRGSTQNSKKVLPPNVAWTEAPSFADVAAAYPERARAEGKGGRATLSCHMNSSGRLVDCEAATTNPRGYGFDQAAKKLARQFAYALNSPDDRKAARDLVVHLPFTFDPAMLGEAPPVVGKPTWATIPTGEQLRSAFAGLKVNDTVRVALSCNVAPGGQVAQCALASEEPAGAGIGAAALALAPAFRLSTWTVEGLPVIGGTVKIPLRYEPTGPAEAASE